MMTPHLFVNGKFAAQRLTGVQRVAEQLVRVLDERAAALPWRCTLLCPAGASPPRLRRIDVRMVGPRWPSLHLWEQTSLPLAARGGLLLSLAGSAPWFARHQACLLHDAAPFEQSAAYTRLFGLWYRSLFRHLARTAAVLLTVSGFSRERLAQHLGLPAARLAVVSPGADHLAAVVPDTSVLARLGLEGRRYLLAVASDSPSKNLPRLLAAFARLPPEPDLRLVIVGAGNPRVFARRSAAGDPPGVLRAGALDDAALKALYCGAVALVFPSLYEGFGLPPLEAMACGCPVIASRSAAIPEVCGDAALYVHAHDTDELAAALSDVLQGGEVRRRLAEAGRQRAGRFTWARSADALVAALLAPRTA